MLSIRNFQFGSELASNAPPHFLRRAREGTRGEGNKAAAWEPRSDLFTTLCIVVDSDLAHIYVDSTPS